MKDLMQDVRYGCRLLLRDPLFALVAIVSLALGIGANTTIFSIFNTIFLRTISVPDPERLAAVFTSDAKNTGQMLDYMQISFPNYQDFRDQNQVFSGLSAQIAVPMSLSSGGPPERVIGMAVTGNYFQVLGVQAAVGRTFVEEDDAVEGRSPLVVLSYTIWQRRFGGDRNLIGSQILLNRQNFTVLGVTPPGFRGTFAIGGPDLFVPLGMHDQVLADFALQSIHSRRGLLFNVFGRLKSGFSMAQARADMQRIARSLEQAYPKDNEARSVSVLPLAETLVNPNIRGQALLAGTMMLAVVGFVLLIACANVANLLLARAGVRQREIAIRLSLGAGRMRLIRQLLTESLIMASLAGLLGLLLAAWCRDLLWIMRPPFWDDNALTIPLDLSVLTFTGVLTLLTGVLFGLVPALQTTHVDLAWALKDRNGLPRRTGRILNLRNVLVVVQVALSLVALASAGLFLRSMQNAQRIDPGFERQNLFMISLDLAGQAYDDARGREFYGRVTESVTAMPQVKGVALASAPLFGGDLMRTVFVEGQDTSDPRNGRLTGLFRVSPGYFETIRMPLVRGRGFLERDRENAPLVAVVNETMAGRLWPGEEAIGKRFRCFGQSWLIEVVGIARNAKYNTLGEEPQSFMYFPLLQHYSPAVTLHVRTAGNPAKVMGVVRSQVQALDPSMPLVNVATIGEVMEAVLWPPRMGAILLAAFSALALILAAIGIHGVVSYSVAQRTQEIGIRMALGAQSGDILKLILGQTGLIVAIGGLLGLAGAYAGSIVLASLLFGMERGDLLSLAGTTLLLAATALVASFLPARRAMRLDPVTTLRSE